MQDKSELARRYLLRAEEVRMIAEGLYDEKERKKLMRVADDYEQFAREEDVKMTVAGTT